MCARYTLNPFANLTPDQLAVFAGHDARFVPEPSFADFAAMKMERPWNIAPTQRVPVIRVNPATGKREIVRLGWGLIPAWAKEGRRLPRPVNAKAETIAKLPMFREPFRKRRCLMPATGFYEWRDAGTKHAQPWFIRLAHTEVFAFAAIWDAWTPKSKPDAPPVETCALVTTTANAAMRVIHDRMPVILPPDRYDAWLDPREEDPAKLAALLLPCPDEWLTLHPVSRRVNNARSNSPDLTDPVPAQAELFNR
jgi:putative SOS response-associated peptidase YedK